MYEETIAAEYSRARGLRLTTIKYKESEIVLVRADTLSAGIKTFVGRGLVAKAVTTGAINNQTKAVVVHGGGNTATGVREALRDFGLRAATIAVVYNETSVQVRNRLRDHGIEVVADSPRSEGRSGRLSTATQLCEQPGYVQLEQHEQPLIVDIQQRTLGRAVVHQLSHAATHMVAGVGTGGTLFGLAGALRELNPALYVCGVEGVGSTLTLWHSYLCAAENFEIRRAALQQALRRYEQAGMLVTLQCRPENLPEEWFEIAIDFPPDTKGVVGIEGLGVGDPSQLIMSRLATEVDDCLIVTDDQARRGMAELERHGIQAVESAGANFFATMHTATELRRTGQPPGRIVTVVTAARR